MKCETSIPGCLGSKLSREISRKTNQPKTSFPLSIFAVLNSMRYNHQRWSAVLGVLLTLETGGAWGCRGLLATLQFAAENLTLGKWMGTPYLRIESYQEKLYVISLQAIMVHKKCWWTRYSSICLKSGIRFDGVHRHATKFYPTNLLGDWIFFVQIICSASFEKPISIVEEIFYPGTASVTQCGSWG